MRFGVIGCGAVARQCHGPSLRNTPGAVVAGACDRDPDAARAFAAEFRCEALSLDDLLGRCEIAVIATPPSSHAGLIEKALAAGRSVLVEKPFVTSHADAVRLTDLGRRSGLGLYVGHLRRFRSGATLARRLVELGVLGRVTRVEAFEGARFGWGTASGYVREDRYGGVLHDTGSHTLDLALYASGWEVLEAAVEVKSVARDKPEPAHEIDAAFRLVSNQGTLDGRLKLSRYRPMSNLVRLIGELGHLEFDAGFQEPVLLTTPKGCVRLQPDGSLTPFEHCFAAQYRSILEEQRSSRLVADRFITLTRVLETLHGHTGS